MNSYQLYKLIILIVYEKKLELNININQKIPYFYSRINIIKSKIFTIINFIYIYRFYLWKLYYYLVYQKRMLFLVLL
jgi:hypothetical protein